jgi:hypothetical protein
MEVSGGPMGSGTASASGDPGRGPGTEDSLVEDDREAFLLDLFLTTGPGNASSSEQNPLLMTPLLEVKFFSVILDPRAKLTSALHDRDENNRHGVMVDLARWTADRIFSVAIG